MTPPSPGTQTFPDASSGSPAVAMLAVLTLVATLSGLLIVSTYYGTLDAVTANKRIALERAVRKVIPAAEVVREYYATPGGIIEAESSASPSSSVKFFAAYDGEGGFQGIAAEGAAMGYADVVRLLYGYRPECECIVGVAVVSMRETPGIGDRILQDADFLENFIALDVRLNADLSALAHAVKTVKHGSKSNPWEIDAISGATVTSKAVGRGIQNSAAALLPRLFPHVGELQKREG